MKHTPVDDLRHTPTLIMPIKKQWFDMILSGRKKEEYREIKQYYRTRLFHAIEPKYRQYYIEDFDDFLRHEPEMFYYAYIYVVFRNGYTPKSPSFLAQCWLGIGHGREVWGAGPGKEYYVLHIEKIYREYATGLGQIDGEVCRGWIVREHPGHIVLFEPSTGNGLICGEIVDREVRAVVARSDR